MRLRRPLLVALAPYVLPIYAASLTLSDLRYCNYMRVSNLRLDFAVVCVLIGTV